LVELRASDVDELGPFEAEVLPEPSRGPLPDYVYAMIEGEDPLNYLREEWSEELWRPSYAVVVRSSDD